MNCDKNERLKRLRRQKGAMKAKFILFHMFLETFNIGHDTIKEQDTINLEQ